MQRRTAHHVRLALGLIMAVGLGVGAYVAEGWGLLTYLLPLAILLLTVADFIGYLSGTTDQPRSAHLESEAAPGAAVAGGRDPGSS